MEQWLPLHVRWRIATLTSSGSWDWWNKVVKMQQMYGDSFSCLEEVEEWQELVFPALGLRHGCVFLDLHPCCHDKDLREPHTRQSLLPLCLCRGLCESNTQRTTGLWPRGRHWQNHKEFGQHLKVIAVLNQTLNDLPLDSFANVIFIWVFCYLE